LYRAEACERRRASRIFFYIRNLTVKQKTVRCLLVDDSIAEQKLFEQALLQTGLPVTCRYASDAAKCYTKLLNAPAEDIPEIIFLDIYMPGWDGKKFLQMIRKQEHLKNIPVYIYSSSSDQPDVMELMKSGATFYIIKTSNISALSKTLEMMLRRFYQ